MPTYTYRCKACGRRFEKALTLGEHERKRKPACPRCKSRKVEQAPAGFSVVTSKKG